MLMLLPYLSWLVPGVLAAAPAPALDRVVLCMGTRLAIHLEGAPPDRLRAASDGFLQDLDRIEAACSTWRPDSAWSRLNAARGEAVDLAPEWLDLLASIQAWNHRTGGAFDPVLMSLLRAWGIREGGRTPSPAQLEQARKASGAGLLRLDPARGKARLLDPEAGVEEGGFLKGYALDSGLKVLRAGGIPAGWLDFGGQVLVWGRSREVDVADPDARARARFKVRVPDGSSLSSSGCSERGRHILDPATGAPCPDWGSVAVVAPSGLDADVLSTALYVMGPERGAAWAQAQGVAAVFLRHGGQEVRTPAFLGLDGRSGSGR